MSGVAAFASGEVADSLAAVAGRLGVTEGQSRPGVRDQLLERGLERLGWHAGPLPRNVRGCAQDAGCGWCGFGCRLGAKQSTLVTYLEEAAAAGARLVVGADARRVLISSSSATGQAGRAVGLEAVADGGHRLVVRARAVVAAAGAVETPALLLRSGLGGQVGRHLRLHPGTAAMGLFPEPVRWWEGTLQARWSAELRQRLGPYAPIFETVPVHPGTAAVALPWQSAAAHRALMERSANLSLVGVLCRDSGAGRVRVDRDGSPRVRYRLNAADEARMAAGVAAAGEVLAAAGASEVFSIHRQRFSFRPGAPDAHRAWADATRQAGFAGGRATLASYHQMGSCRMGADPATSAVGPDHRTHEVEGLFVADASLFPTASGVNPCCRSWPWPTGPPAPSPPRFPTRAQQASTRRAPAAPSRSRPASGCRRSPWPRPAAPRAGRRPGTGCRREGTAPGGRRPARRTGGWRRRGRRRAGRTRPAWPSRAAPPPAATRSGPGAGRRPGPRGGPAR